MARFRATSRAPSLPPLRGGPIWYPAAGCRYYDGGSLSNVGSNGFYWSATPGGGNAYYLTFYHRGDVYPSYDGYRAYGYSVRCLQE